MNITRRNSGFALAVTLVLMALIVIVIVAYLANTRTDRSTSSIYANQLRAKMVAESGLAAATKLLADNTRYGNYITAIPAPSPTPVSHYTELYRPTDPADSTHALKANDYLRFSNAAGELLISLAAPTPASSPVPQVDPRPTPALIYPTPIPTPLPAFALPSPNPQLSDANSHNFNQVIRSGTSGAGRLVDPDAQPAYGQWVRVRNSFGELTGRYAFYVEDESMKLNVNSTGNNLGSPNLRLNDLAAVPASTPASQIQQIDPTVILPPADRSLANAALIPFGPTGNRLATNTGTGLLNKWDSIEIYAHLLTAVSKDDNTTARGWKRLDLNKLVADAELIGTNAAKAAVATKIANWIRDAWTGPAALSDLQYQQLFNDSRLRLQIAANIVDYIDQDSIPTDLGDVLPTGYTVAIPVLGIEKIPYLEAVEVIYEASGSTCPTPAVIGSYSATLKMKVRFRFLNLYETTLDLANSVNKIVLQGLPIVSKNGTIVYDPFLQIFTLNLADLTPVSPPNSPLTIPAGTDGTGDSGARTFQTGWLTTQTVPFSVTSTDEKPRLIGGSMTVQVYGLNGGVDVRLDNTTIVTNLITTGYKNSGGNSIGDFLNESNTAALQVASINLVYGLSGASTFFETGDPRYRAPLVNDRWRNVVRSDATTPSGWTQPDRITSFIDKAELNARSFGADWYDNIGDRPLAFIRNGPMLSIGELGNVSAAEYYWRTLYLQHPERPTNTAQAGPKDDIPLRRSQSQDAFLVDLFRAGGSDSRVGALNINTQNKFTRSGWAAPILPLHGLFSGVPLGTSLPSPTPIFLTQATPAAATPTPSPAERLSTGVNLLVNCMTVAPASGQFIGTVPLPYRIASLSNKRQSLAGETTTPDNKPERPYFEAGEVSSTISRLLSASEASDTGSSTSRSKVVYSALRSDPQSTTTVQFYRRDFQVEQAYREVSNAITTRGNVFRVLYVGQAIKDVNKDGVADNSEVQTEYLGEAYIERAPVYAPDAINPDAVKTADSTLKIISSRVITQ